MDSLDATLKRDSRPEPGDALFGEVALACGFVTRERLDECLREQEREREAGRPLRLGQILLQKRYLSTAQFVEILEIQSRDVAVCAQCNRPVPLAGLTRARCPQCGGALKGTAEESSWGRMILSWLERDRKVTGSLVEDGLLDTATADRIHARQLESLSSDRLLSLRDAARELEVRLDEAISEREGAAAAIRRIGPYDIERPLGCGGMGIVYAARDSRLGRDVAVKVLRGICDPDKLERFRREEHVMARLHHPGIVQIFDVGEEEGQPYFVMERVEGEDLLNALQKRRLSRREAVEVVRQAAEAVAFAHRHGVLHRDLKPANILVTPQKRAMVMDFGLAKLLESPEHGLSVSGEAMGTPAYMSPEQARGAWKELDARTDVWALGATLYHALSGQPPFRGDSMAETLRKVQQEEPPPIRDVDRELAVVCAKAMEKDPARRYATAAELSEDLRRHLAGEPILARPPSVAYVAKKWIVRRRVLAGAVAAAVLLALSGWWGLTWWGRGRAHARSRVAARAAYAAKNWTQALVECEQGLQARSDPELDAMAADCRGKISNEKAGVERYRRFHEEKLKPLMVRIEQARPLFYVDNIDIRARLEEIEAGLEELESFAEDPAYADYPEVWRLLGTGLYFVGDPDRAEQALLRAEALDPHQPSVQYTLGRILLERAMELVVDQNRFLDEESKARIDGWCRESARRMGSVANWSEATEIERQLIAASLAAAERDFETVGRICKAGLEKFGDAIGTEQFWFLLAWAPDVERTEAERQVRYDKAIKRMPQFAWAYMMRSEGRKEAGDWKGAIEDLDRAIAIQPRFERAYVCRGEAKRLMHDYPAALADFEIALKLNPEDDAAYNNRGLIRDDQGDCDGAIADFGRATRIRPKHPMAYLNRCAAWLGKGDLEQAMADADRALEADPHCAMAYVNRGLVYKRLGDPHREWQEYEQAVKHGPTLPEAWNNLGQSLFFHRSDVEGALSSFDQALKLRPRYDSALAGRARCRIARKEYDLAIADLSEALSLPPRDPITILHIRGHAWEGKGAPSEALADYREALQRAPANWEQRAEVEQHIGALEKK